MTHLSDARHQSDRLSAEDAGQDRDGTDPTGDRYDHIYPVRHYSTDIYIGTNGENPDRDEFRRLSSSSCPHQRSAHR